jgi:dTDP-4-amino-4,6-dideoxygalactose transaminase
MNRNTDYIPFALPDIGREEEEAVIRVLRSGWLTTGGESKAFEEEFGRFVGSPHALAVNSATSGLHLALEALGVGPGDRVLTTPYTFTASAEVVRYLGADPEFVDIERESFAVDPDGIERALADRKGKGRVAAILPVHIAGEVRGMDRILSISRRYGIPVVEDSAHAFPSKTAGGYAGTLGRIGVYSFYATKTITTGEGGMIVTEDEGLSRRMGIMRLHGIDREIWNRYTSKDASWRYGVVEAGYKYNMTDLAAALGRVQLRRAEEFLDKRAAIARRYREAFRDRDYLVLPAESEGHAWHLFLLRIDESKLTIDRDEYIERLRELGIGTSVHFIPLHLHPYWRDRYGLKRDDFPESVKKFGSSISIPIYPALTEARVERIIQGLTSVGDSRYRKA